MTRRFGKAEGALIVILASLTLLTIYFVFHPDQATIIQFWNYNELGELIPALGICFVVCFLANLLPIPTPYVFVVWSAGYNLIKQNIFFPTLVAIVASVGCFLGEVASYLLGRGVAKISKGIEFRTVQQLQALLARHPRLAPLIIFLFGLTPLNDDLLIMPLGFIKYSARKTLFFCWLGKLGMSLIIAHLWFKLDPEPESWWLSMLLLFVLVIIMYLMVKVDWFALLEKVRVFFARKTDSPRPSLEV